MDFLINLAIIIGDEFMLFMINLIVARHSGEELFGDYMLATNGLLMLSCFTTFGVDLIIAYYLPKLYKEEKYRDIVELLKSIYAFLKPKYLIILVGGIFITVTCIALSKVASDLTLFDISHPLFLFLWGAVAISLHTIYLQFFRTVGYMRTAILLSCLQRVCYFLLSILIAFYIYPVFFRDETHYFPHMMLIGFISSYIIIEIIAFLYQKYKVPPFKEQITQTIPRVWKGKIYGYTLQNINGYIYSIVPLMIIEWIGPNEDSVGLFSAVISIIGLANVAISPLAILMGPDISRSLVQDKETIKKVMTKYLLMCGAMGMVVMLIIGVFARQILILYKFGFLNALPYIHICLVAILIYALVTPITILVQSSRHGNSSGAKVTINLLLLQMACSFIFIFWFDLAGAIICFLGLNLVNFIIMIVLALRVYNTAFLPENMKLSDI